MSRNLAGPALTALGAALLLAASGVAHAQEVPCVGADGGSDLPCAFQIRDLALEPVPTLFDLQARISQAKLPIGDQVFQVVVVKALAGDEVVCLEELTGVEVIGSVLNLTIGQNMGCDLARVIAERPNLAFQVCLEGPAQCLKPIELSTAPYAIQSTWASLAQESQEAQVAGQANYAHRATADRDMLARRMIGTGYFDFATPASGPSSESSGGYVQWTPVRDPAARSLHVSSKDQGTDALVPLDELVLAAEHTEVQGTLTVTPSEDGDGLTVAEGGLHVADGDAGFADALLVTGAAITQGAASIAGDASVGGALVAGGQVQVDGGGAHVTGVSSAGGPLAVGGLLEVLSGVDVSGDLFLDGTLTASAMKVTGGLVVAGAATFGTLVAGTAQVAGAVTAGAIALGGVTGVGGDLTVGGTLTVVGPTVFHGHVVFEGGGGEGEGVIDPTYVLAEGETRDLAFGGAGTFGGPVGLGGPLDLQNHQLLGYRMEASAGPPAACDGATEGALYLDTVEQNLVACVGGAWVELGGDECGNAFVEPSEGCDDGNAEAGDGCDAGCAPEVPGWDCTPVGIQPTVCASICGDGWPRGEETCDDGELAPGDGCDAGCQTEAGWACEGEPSTCAPVCGDGLLAGGQACDDGDVEPGDGCDAGCAVEFGWSCEGEPSDCQYGVCGDGVIFTELGEICDDGNDQGGDGCSATCQVEPNSECQSEPSVCVVHGSVTLDWDFPSCATSTWVVPANVTSVSATVVGARGGATGGYGAHVTGTISVTAGETLTLQAGSSGGTSAAWAGGSCGGGDGGGGTGPWVDPSGSGGGGYSAIFEGTSVGLGTVILLAGGGGGGQFSWNSVGGGVISNGADSGQGWGGSNGTPGLTGYGDGGDGGQWSYGGAAGWGQCNNAMFSVSSTVQPTAGGPLQGGDGGRDYPGDTLCVPNTRGGGGGAGYYGGGGGSGWAYPPQGGGGSGGSGASYYKSARVSDPQVWTSGNAHGYVTLSW